LGVADFSFCEVIVLTSSSSYELSADVTLGKLRSVMVLNCSMLSDRTSIRWTGSKPEVGENGNMFDCAVLYEIWRLSCYLRNSGTLIWLVGCRYLNGSGCGPSEVYAFSTKI